MKITPEDMDAVRDVLDRAETAHGLRGKIVQDRDRALATILERIYDRGYQGGFNDALDHTYNPDGASEPDREVRKS